MRVSNKVWLLAAISLPLTFFTILLWWGWVHFTKVEQTIDPAKPGVVTLQRAHSFRSTLRAGWRILRNACAVPPFVAQRELPLGLPMQARSV
jgi:hypothetical protein